MKAKAPAKSLTLIQLFDRFDTDEKARKHLELILWPNGPVCPHCKCNDQAKIAERAANKDKKIRPGLRFCSNCQKQFTVTIGTIFEDSHIPLRKWLIAWYLLCSSKKGIASLALQRLLELGSYRTALFMTHRIRYALQQTTFAEKLSGTVEVDEASIKSRAGDGREFGVKVAVVAMVQRGGAVRSQVMKTVSAINLKEAVMANVEKQSQVHTDKLQGYVGLRSDYDHRSVKHGAGEFSRHEGPVHVTTANVESYFSLLKRGVVGTFHHISEKHLPLYLAEFDFRHSLRNETDGQRTDIALTKAAGKRLIYKTA